MLRVGWKMVVMTQKGLIFPHQQQKLYGKSFLYFSYIFHEFKTLNRQFWGRHFWARYYFAASSGNVTDELMMKYIEQQGHEPPEIDFKIDGEP